MPTELRHHVDLSNNTHDVIEDPDDTDATEEIRITRMSYLIFLYHGLIAGQILLIFYEIYCVGDYPTLCTEGNISISVRILKWFLRGIFAQISQIRSLYVGNHWSRAWDKMLDFLGNQKKLFPKSGLCPRAKYHAADIRKFDKLVEQNSFTVHITHYSTL
jgi:hypothetical protein